MAFFSLEFYENVSLQFKAQTQIIIMVDVIGNMSYQYYNLHQRSTDHCKRIK